MPDNAEIQVLKDKANAMLAERHLTAEADALISNLRGQIEVSGQTKAELRAKAQGLFAEAETMMNRNDTTSDAAKELARRWWTLLPGFKPPATPKLDEVSRTYKEAMADPAIATGLPFNPAALAFVGAIVKAMRERGEL